ncbi:MULTISPECIES: sensor domain-containing diguanylate cyclase [Deefgea]|uniref:Diguanylate cyclase n=1 Tax=Deefgea chitinilytica TaxID=570276 RepID=A0ABS2CEP2_9NEIS|nr:MULTISPECIES: sensor domain-containing diguanylate cyclase [Deefgea]MBM5572629.1 diguanylate cyclase [Deefgea chitinilytica]MBM9889865.1 sensor domain-containing diguanylate cyclase [Deefgea sp. CFH1-16]
MPKPLKSKRFIYLAWLALLLLSYSLYTLFWWQNQHILHTQKHNQIAQQIAQLQAQADTVLESFAAFQSRLTLTQDKTIRPFAELLLKRNPHIYCLQTVQRVTHSEVAGLERTMRAAGYRGFQVHDFDYDKTRKSLPLKVSAVHFPIVFMAPLPREAEQVLGLDVNAVHFLSPQLQNSGQQVKGWSTGPFRLIEGDIAYGLTIPVYQLGGQNPDSSWPLYAGLVIKAKDIIAKLQDFPPGWQVRMEYIGVANAAQVELFNVRAAGSLAWLDRLLPQIEIASPIASDSQPFKLYTQQQLRWQSWLGMVPLMMAAFLLLVLLLALRWQYSERLRRITVQRHKNQLHRWATQDRLTRCANRQNFDQRMSIASQSETPFTLVYLDLDYFKPINDQYGHLAGDAVLLEVAQRLRRTVRSQDLVARWGGDEFAILVLGLSDQERCAALRQALLDALAPPFIWQAQTLTLSASIGIASYPAEAQSVSELLQLADQRMYRHKVATRNREVEI